MVRQRFLVPSLTGSSPVPAIVRLDKLHPFKMEEGQILYGAWCGVGALLMLMVLIKMLSRMVHDHKATSTGTLWVVPSLWRFDSAHQH